MSVSHTPETAGFRSLLRGASLMAGAEMFNRIARLAAIVVMARYLSVADFALVALCLTVWELVRMLSHNGLGARIVTAGERELGEVCRAVNRLNWMVGGSMFVLQCLLAIPVARAFGKPEAAPMLVFLALTYLVNPMVMVRAFLAQRVPGLRFSASSSAALAATDNLLTSALVFAGMGPWGALLPKIILAPFWVFAHLKWAPRPPESNGGSDKIGDIFGFSLRIFLAEGLTTLRQHADRLVVGRVLGMEALGMYAFAANSGAGITQSLSTAVGNAVLPFIAASGKDGGAVGRFWTSVRLMAAGIVPIVALQAIFAPYYVPVVFGTQWAPVAPLLSILCLASLSRIILVPMAQLLRVYGLPHIEVQQSAFASLAFIAGLAAGLPFGLESAAIGVAVANLASMPVILIWGLRAVAEYSSTIRMLETAP